MVNFQNLMILYVNISIQYGAVIITCYPVTMGLWDGTIFITNNCITSKTKFMYINSYTTTKTWNSQRTRGIMHLQMGKCYRNGDWNFPVRDKCTMGRT